MYSQDLALDKLQILICHKTQPTNQSNRWVAVIFWLNYFILAFDQWDSSVWHQLKPSVHHYFGFTCVASQPPCYIPQFFNAKHLPRQDDLLIIKAACLIVEEWQQLIKEWLYVHLLYITQTTQVRRAEGCSSMDSCR